MNLSGRFLFILLAALIFSACSPVDWRTADRSSSGIAPLPADAPEAIVQVYTARAINWRGYLGVHSWIATKEANANHYTTYHVIGFQLRRGPTSLRIGEDVPDRRWFGAEPRIVEDLRGPPAATAIPKIQAAANSYPYAATYAVWPGPNSNTFISYILRQVPELQVELPPTAIGKDWLGYSRLADISESGTGRQLSLYGILGLTVGLAEGIEVNILGLNFGIDVLRPALKLPLLGRLGMQDAPVFGR